MEWLLNLWSVCEPYVLEALKWFASTGAGVAVGSWIIKKWSKKYENKELVEDISANVSSNIVNKEVLVSLESVNKTQLNNIKADLKNEISSAVDVMEGAVEIVKSMAKVMLKFKAATEEERQEILKALNKVETKQKIALTKEVKTDPVVIKIEPVSKKEVEEDSLF
jgi:hypothetical protein